MHFFLSLIVIMDKKNNKKIVKDYSYPNPNDENLQEKIFKKREFYYHRIPRRDILKTDDEIQKYRDENCPDEFDFELKEHQKIITNLLSPHTPYNGILLMYGTGTGKTASAISIAEQFKEQVKKYNTKIYVLVPGPNTRENFKKELVFTTGETYIKNKRILEQMTKNDREREYKIGVYGALQFYKLLSYKTFYRKVLGEKIAEKRLEGDKIIKTYKKTDDGEIERELVVDRISNMDNSIIIVDEAHNLTGNEYGEALMKIKKVSKNLKIILLSATPMKNLASDIVDLINFVRPIDKPIKKDLIFTSDKNVHLNDFKQGGKEILKKMSRGYVSYFRGNTPYTFADRVDKGVIPNGLLFTPLVKCEMDKFQEKGYNKAAEKSKSLDDTSKMDSLFRAASAAANFVFPGLSSDKKKLEGYYSTDGMTTVISQLNADKKTLLNKINKELYKGKLNKADLENFILEDENKNLIGRILSLDYLKDFSVKFYKCIKRLEKLVEGNKGAGTAFIYSNLVKAGGIELFANALKQNGYLEYMENKKDYDIKDDTVDAITGKTFAEFKKKGKDLNTFFPATYILVTGGVDESGEDLPEIKQKIIRNVFNNANNKDGRELKLVLGSKVMNEGVTLENIREIHILDVHYNLGKVEQVIGRGIRMCKHKAVTNENNMFPKVNVYRYVVSKKNELSTDEILYQKAELKYLLVKETERVIKENSIDCPLLLHGNKYPEEIEKYKGCVYPTLENVKKGKKICPQICDFTDCNFKCAGESLNKKYWDNNTKSYKQLNKQDIDYNTFNDDLAKYEIENIKSKIKDLYRFKHVYVYDEILNLLKESYKDHQKELFDQYFLDQALEDLMPKTENEENNFKDNITDKYDRIGYLIQRKEYYIFQPFDENEGVPLYYRQKMDIEQDNLVPVYNYIKKNYSEVKEKELKEKTVKIKRGYNFDTVLDYYEVREENFVVGIVVMNLNKLASQDTDLFKIRPPRAKVLDKKRGTGIPTFKGAVCSTSKDKGYLLKLIKKLPNYKNDEEKALKKMTRESICDQIKNKLLELEKYATSKDKNKKTYVMIPSDHPKFPFTYNLEDRVKSVVKKINKIINRDIGLVTKKMKNGIFLGERNASLTKYQIEFKDTKYTKEKSNELKKLGGKLEKNTWIILIE